MALALVRRVWRGIGEDDCGFMAAALAYQIFFSLIPLVLLIVGLSGVFLSTEALRNAVVVLLRDIYPGLGDRRLVDEIMSAGGVSLGLGIVGTLWSVSALYGSLARVLRGVLGGTRPNFLRNRLHGIGFGLLLTALALLSFAASFVVQAFTGWLRTMGVAERVTLELLSPLAGLLAGFVLFFAIYRVVSPLRVPLGSLVAGAAGAAFLWEAGKLGFAIFVRESGTFRGFGTLALAAALLTWIYLTAFILLVGAELVKAVMELRRT